MTRERADLSQDELGPAELRTLLAQGPVLLYDGECGVCAASVQWILRHERSTGLRFSALDSPIGQGLQRIAHVPAGVDSLVWVNATAEGASARLYSSAVLSALDYVGGVWQLVHAALWIVPKPLRDGAYRLFARVRRKFAPNQCLLPTPEQRARFLLA
jgi:predicted DCC family thiol-disulfide oxidoreductase YuxK